MRYAFSFLLSLALCFAAQSLALRLSGGETSKSESNYFSSLGRIQAGARGDAQAMVLGSSITRRLPDRVQGFSGWANMGCDGGSAVDALRAMDKGILPNAPLLVIEANTLHKSLGVDLSEIGRAMQGIWFRMGLKIPAIAAYARPSAFFYSALMERKLGNFEDINRSEDLGVSSQPREVTEIPEVNFTPEQQRLIDEVSAILGRLREKNSKSVVVWLPPARSDDSPPAPWQLELTRRSTAPFWDLGQEAAPGTVRLTDRHHMDAPSAARTMVSLQKALER